MRLQLSTAAFLISLFTLLGCAGAKIRNERVQLQRGAISKQDIVLVKAISADNANFVGDKSGDAERVGEEKQIIKAQLARDIVEALNDKGFHARLFGEAHPDSAVVLEGKVTEFDHGSAAARGFVGMGAGSSNLFISLRVVKGRSGSLVADFDAIATSGGRGGVFAMSSFLDAHMRDGAKKIADYFAKHATE